MARGTIYKNNYNNEGRGSNNSSLSKSTGRQDSNSNSGIQLRRVQTSKNAAEIVIP